MVPNHVLCGSLSSDAVAALCFVMTKPSGYELRVAEIRKRFDWGRTKWLRVSKELRETGAIIRTEPRTKGGTLVGIAYEICWPDDDRSSDYPTIGQPDRSSVENQTEGGLKTRPLNKTKTKTSPIDADLFEEYRSSAKPGMSFDDWKNLNQE